MQSISYDKIIAEVETTSLWVPARLGYLTYLYGVPQFALIREAEPADEPTLMTLKIRPYGLEVCIIHDFKPYYVGLPISAVCSAELTIPSHHLAQQPAVINGLRDEAGITDGNALLTIHVEQADNHYHIVAAVPKDKWQLAREFIEQLLP